MRINKNMKKLFKNINMKNNKVVINLMIIIKLNNLSVNL